MDFGGDFLGGPFGYFSLFANTLTEFRYLWKMNSEAWSGSAQELESRPNPTR